MADIELVIKIPKYIYNTIVANDGYIADCDNEKVGMAVINGTLLPKGYGRLIDADAIVYEKECIYLSDGSCTTICIPNISKTPTIIEADKEDGK